MWNSRFSCNLHDRFQYELLHAASDKCAPRTPESTISFRSRGRLTSSWYLGFEVLTAVGMKRPIFWDTKPCIPLYVNQRFEGTCRLHLQGRRITRGWNQPQYNSACQLLSRWILARLWRCRKYIPLKCRLAFNGLNSSSSLATGPHLFQTDTSSPKSAILSFLLQLPVSSCFLQVIQQQLTSPSAPSCP
jgi:hypothetical protein